MKKIAFSFALVCSTCFVLFGQQQPTFEVYLNKNAMSSNEKYLGHYNNSYEKGAPLLGFLGWFVTEGEISPFEGWETDLVRKQQITSKRNYSLGFRIGVGSNRRVKVGFSTNRFEYDMTRDWASGIQTSDTEEFTAVMTDVQYAWVSRKHLTCYSGAGLGLTKHEYENKRQKTDGQKMHAAGQFTPIGVRFNAGPVGAHIECGVGSLGMVRGGLSVAF
jgi:hypothetical protein